MILIWNYQYLLRPCPVPWGSIVSVHRYVVLAVIREQERECSYGTTDPHRCLAVVPAPGSRDAPMVREQGKPQDVWGFTVFGEVFHGFPMHSIHWLGLLIGTCRIRRTFRYPPWSAASAHDFLRFMPLALAYLININQQYQTWFSHFAAGWHARPIRFHQILWVEYS